MLVTVSVPGSTASQGQAVEPTLVEAGGAEIASFGSTLSMVTLKALARSMYVPSSSVRSTVIVRLARPSA